MRTCSRNTKKQYSSGGGGSNTSSCCSKLKVVDLQHSKKGGLVGMYSGI